MVLEKPIIDARELMRALDPVHGRAKREYDLLRQAELLSLGIAANGRANRTPLAGRTLYCSLNRDAISAVRRGHTETARDIRAHAQRIERDTLGPWLEAALDSWLDVSADAMDDPVDEDRPNDWVDRLVYAGQPDYEGDVAEPVWDAARDVAEVRARYDGEDTNVRLTIGRVWRIEEVFSEVRAATSLGTDSFAFFTDEVLSAGLRLGDPVVVRHEELGPGVFLTTLERAIERSRRVSRVTGQTFPRHLDDLLDSTELSRRKRSTRTLRRLA